MLMYTRLRQGFIATYYVLILVMNLSAFMNPPYSAWLAAATLLSVVAVGLVFPELKALFTQRKQSRPAFTLNTRRTGFSLFFFVVALYALGTHLGQQDSLRTPEQRQAVAEQQQRKQAELDAWLKSPEGQAQQRKAEEDYNTQAQVEQRERQAQRDTEKAQQVAEENARQTAFYETLAAPKLLFKCKDKPSYRAIGAKYGTYNVVLAEAYDTCGAGQVDIINKAP